MEKAATVAGGETATATGAVAPAQMDRAAVVTGMAEALGEPQEGTTNTEQPTSNIEGADPEKTVKEEAEPEAKAEEAADAEEDKELTPRAKEILQKRFDKMTAKTKAEVEAAQTAAETAAAEAEALRGQLDPARRESIQKTGLMPELLDAPAAAVLKEYDNALAGMQSAKDIQRRSRAMIEAGTHVDEAGVEKVFEGQGFDGKPFRGTARQWRDLAEDARDTFEPRLQELAPQASTIKRETAARQAEIFKLGLAALKQREAAAKKVATVAGDKGKAPVKVEVQAAAGTKVTGGPKSKTAQTLDEFEKSPKSRDDIAAAMGAFVT